MAVRAEGNRGGKKHNLKNLRMMEVALKESLINYFSQLEKTDEKWKEFSKSIERPLVALKNQTEQFRHVVSKEVDNAEICQLDEIRDKLIFKITLGIEDEVSQILNALRRMKNLIEDLKNKLARLEVVRSDVLLNEPSFKILVDGTPLIPKLDLLMEWAIESSKYYTELSAKVFENFKALDYKNEDSVKNWVESFEQNRQDRARIERILGFTQFLIKESTK